ncbi:uncharacterized protein LOC142323544 isoform X2 [Lycorma delicatula]
MAYYDITVLCFTFLMFFEMCQCGPFKPPQKQTRETNVFNFVRLLVLRLIYGVATMMGFSENISEFANGALVPPGVEDDYGIFGDRNSEDDDYSYYDY